MNTANILKIESLNEGWSDKDQVILHACFQLLTDSIEKKNLFTGNINWEYDSDHIQAKKEIEEIYAWWIIRKELEKNGNIDPIWTKNQYHQDNEMLIRLINIRKFLWT